MTNTRTGGTDSDEGEGDLSDRGKNRGRAKSRQQNAETGGLVDSPCVKSKHISQQNHTYISMCTSFEKDLQI